MSKFKVGDKVLCVDNSYKRGYLTKGKVYEVVDGSFNNPFYVHIKHDGELDVGGYSVERFVLLEDSLILTPEEVFKHLRDGTELEIFGRYNTRTGSIEKWLDAPPVELITYNTIVSHRWRIKPEPEVIELNGKKYREIVE